MLKRKFRGIILCVAGVMALAMGTAHADVTVSIDLATGDTIWSLPGLPEGVDYPEEFQTVVTGGAGFDSTNGSVFYEFTVPAPDGPPIVVYTSQANLAPAGCSAECTWSFRVPFFMPPNEYDLIVTATEPNIVNPDDPGPSASDSVHIVVL
jgi:hypothetical protein